MGAASSKGLRVTQHTQPDLSTQGLAAETGKCAQRSSKTNPNLTVFCILIFGLAGAQVIDVAANLTERGCVLC